MIVRILALLSIAMGLAAVFTPAVYTYSALT